jgi:hypothetical protein
MRWRCFIFQSGRARTQRGPLSLLYATELGRKYSGLKPDLAAQKARPPDLPEGTEEQVFTTNEGPVLITIRGKQVFVAESFPLDLARKLTTLILDAQGTGDLRMAVGAPLAGDPLSGEDLAARPDSEGLRPLTADLSRFLSSCGVAKFAVDGALRVVR